MRKVLMVAYIFAPTASTGVHRTVKFVKYLPQFQWTPLVLTTGNSAYPATDPSLLDDVPAGTAVLKVRAFEDAHARRLVRKVAGCFGAGENLLAGLDWRVGRLFDPLSIPDMHAPWALAAVARGLWAILRHRVDVIYSTSWPYSDHLTALILHRLTGRPWVADFRDPWLTNANYHRDPRSRRGRLEAWIERQFVANASAVVSTSDSIVEMFRRRYPAQAAQGKFHTIFNGYDPAGDVAAGPSPSAGGLELLHVGAFYAARSPRVLLEGLAILARSGLTDDDVRLTFVGDMGGHEGLIDQLGLRSMVQCLGRKSVQECGRLVRSCQALCLVTAAEHSYAIAGKTYEYLASGKPILALVSDKCETRRIMARSGGVTFADPAEPASVAAAIRQMIQTKMSGAACPGDLKYVEQYSRRNQTRKLAELLDSLVSPV